MVTPSSGKPGKYFDTVSSISSLPSSHNLRVAIPVNVFDTEARWKGVEEVMESRLVRGSM